MNTKKTDQHHQPPVTENDCDVQQTKECISSLYKNATMAQNCLKTLLPYVEQKEVTKQLHKQVEEYDHYVEQVEQLGEKLNFEPTPAPKFALCMANVGIKTKMIADKSATHVGKVMMQGTLNGIIDLYRLQREYPDVHPEVSTLTKRLLRFEEGCLESLKSLL